MTKRELLLESALKLFTENGFHGTATSKIAKEAGVSNGTLFNNFSTKDELVLELYLAIKNEVSQKMKEHLTEVEKDPKLALKKQIFNAIYWAIDNPNKLNYLQQFHFSPYVNLLTEDINSRSLIPHLSLIQEAVDNGVINNIDPDFVYALLGNHVSGVYQYIQSKDFSSDEVNQIVNTSSELFWKMIT
ncbi:TetR/AcrR family transcriptional regulator [Flammeovirga sp. SubArs3]|uniref:TetR/AcrR family transcriptional regulator n=1 Tax=Flammeovirga sp. SubArs3 TaxID=2995316 RepID=UPI00248B24D3|nr:TetR/AcrR family transcriptional regulator [Flammeovirga sp. SubArs3]